MLVVRPLIAWFLVAAAVAEAASLRQGQRGLQAFTQSDDYYSVMLDRVNQARAAHGLPALCTNHKLQRAAQIHSDDQAANDYIDHTGTDGTSISDRVTQAGYDWSSVAENVAAGQPDVDSVMATWMNSPGHRENILGDYTMFGTAYAYSSDSTFQHYWTQDFGTGDAEQCDNGSIASESDSTVTSLEEEGDAPIETDDFTTDESVVVTPIETIVADPRADDSYSGSQETTGAPCTDAPVDVVEETEAPCTDAPVIVVDPSPTEGSGLEGEYGPQGTDTPVVVVDPPEIGFSNAYDTEMPEETPVMVVDPPEIGTPEPEEMYSPYGTPSVQVAESDIPAHGEDCETGF